MSQNRDKCIMLILSSPSGAGKTTITKKIQQKYKNFRISVSHTTRKPRANEIRLAAIDDEILVPVYTLISSWIEFQSFEPIPTNIPVLDPVRDSFELPYIDRAL